MNSEEILVPIEKCYIRCKIDNLLLWAKHSNNSDNKKELDVISPPGADLFLLFSLFCAINFNNKISHPMPV